MPIVFGIIRSEALADKGKNATPHRPALYPRGWWSPHLLRTAGTCSSQAFEESTADDDAPGGMLDSPASERLGRKTGLATENPLPRCEMPLGVAR